MNLKINKFIYKIYKCSYFVPGKPRRIDIGFKFSTARRIKYQRWDTN